MTHIAQVGDKCNIVLGTHNEQSVLNAAQKMLQLGIKPESRQVVFGQIYGMADQISVPLSTAGFKVDILLATKPKYFVIINFDVLMWSFYPLNFPFVYINSTGIQICSLWPIGRSSTLPVKKSYRKQVSKHVLNTNNYTFDPLSRAFYKLTLNSYFKGCSCWC